MQLSIVENVQREDLNPLEEAAAYHDLVERFGYTQERIAQEVGKTQGHISNTIRLLRLPDSVKMMVHQGKLAAGHARALLAMPDVEAAALRVVSEQMTVREVEAASRVRPANVPNGNAKPSVQRDAGPAAFRLGDGRMLKSLPVCEIAATLRLGELELRVLRAVQKRIGGTHKDARLIDQAKGN
jgi:ParB family chromosome partitioning protein